MVQNFNDFQSFSDNLKLSILKREYRWIVYKLNLRLATCITTISQTTKINLLNIFNPVKAVKVILLSGELPRLRIVDEFDFLVIAHSSHKNAAYILNLLSNDTFFSKMKIAVLGNYYSMEGSLPQSFSELNLTRFGKVSDSEYVHLINSSKVIVMNSEVGTEGFGLPIGQSIYLSKSSVISQDPALVEIGEKCSFQLSGIQNLDVEILKNAYEALPGFNSIYNNRMWCDVATEIVQLCNKITK